MRKQTTFVCTKEQAVITEKDVSIPHSLEKIYAELGKYYSRVKIRELYGHNPIVFEIMVGDYDDTLCYVSFQIYDGKVWWEFKKYLEEKNAKHYQGNFANAIREFAMDSLLDREEEKDVA